MKARWREWVRLFALALAIGVGWAHTYRLFEEQRFADPLVFWGDALSTAALVKAASDFEYLPFASKTIPSLGAPTVASWNDYPIPEDFIYVVWGVVARVIGLFAAINLGFLTALVAAGCSLYAVARRFRVRWEWAWCAGLVFGLTPYFFYRNTSHFQLDFFWHVPWNLWLCARLASRRGVPLVKGPRLWSALAVVAVTAFQNPYYFFFCAQLWVLAIVAHLARHGRATWKGPAALLAAAALCFTSVNLDSIAWRAAHGPNLKAVERNPTEVEYYALKPIALLVPSNTTHAWKSMRILGGLGTNQSVIAGEYPSGYAGIVGGAAFLLMLAFTVVAVGRGRADWVARAGLQGSYLLIAAGVGGVSSLLGLFGVTLFRSCNRVSVMVLACALLVAAAVLGRATRRWPRALVAFVTLALAVFAAVEQMPLRTDPQVVAQNAALVAADRKLAEQMEAALPKGAMVFQLPPMHFPEVGPVGGVDSYEQFRPYYFTRSLKYSHGDVKGRASADLKFELANLAPELMIRTLREKGFQALYVNREAYGPGYVEQLVQTAQSMGGRVIGVADTRDVVVLAL